ncbi:hypothetical protein D3C85_1836490 [compost metagenome]
MSGVLKKPAEAHIGAGGERGPGGREDKRHYQPGGEGGEAGQFQPQKRSGERGGERDGSEAEQRFQ